jgi:hypothetical protein
MTDRLALPAALIDPAFIRCAHEAIETPELVANFERLYGTSARSAGGMREFMRFVHDGIYLRIPDEAIEAMRLADAATKEASQP